MIRTLRQTNTGLKRVVSASMREGRLEATPTTRSQCGFLRKLLCLYTPLLLVLLAGCANPYSVSINKINYKAEQKKGIIQFTDPKLYKREALINERRDELAYLKDLLDKSRTQDFKPEIVRELEVITAFSAAMGLKFDPAAAITFERDKETSELVHQIELTRLEMELAQLQRDATLLKEQLEQQKEPSQPPPSTGDGAGELKSEFKPEDATKLLDQIEELRNKLEKRFDTKSEPPKKAEAVAGPIDLFNDRAAYRSTIKSAINAVSLDELHDMNGSSLFRVQLKATVLPEPGDHIDTLGILRMEVIPPDLTNDTKAVRDLYLEWLLHVNQSLNLPPNHQPELVDQRFLTNDRLITLGEGNEVYRLILIELPKYGVGKDKSKKCRGVRRHERDPESCWYLRVASPASDAQAADKRLILSGYGLSFDEMLDLAMQFPKKMRALLNGAAQDLTSRKVPPSNFQIDNQCQAFAEPEGGPIHLSRSDRKDVRGLTPNQALALARSIRGWWPHLSSLVGYLVEVGYEDVELEQSISSLAQMWLAEIRSIRNAAGSFLLAVAEINPNCSHALLTASSIDVPEAFKMVLTRASQRVTVYDVAPGERAQQISTVARAAEAVALAAAVAGQLPQYGLGLSGNFAYSRTAAGKADALERAPLVVGFAEPSLWMSNNSTNPSFGWMLGPEVSLDPEKKELVLEHHMVPYDLYADISMPGWWPYFELKAYTAWAPDWRSAADGKSIEIGKEVLERPMRVPMKHNAADMDGLTTLVLNESTGQRIARPKIASIQPHRLSACADNIQFQIWGENIWRTSMVHIGGHAVDDKNIRVLPDMRGIIVTIKVQDIPVISNRKVKLTVWSQDGSASRTIEFVDIRKDGICAEPGVTTPMPKGPVISKIVPDEISVCDPQPIFTVQGQNLGNPVNATLGTIKGTVTELQPTDGTVLEVQVPSTDMQRKFGKLETLPLTVRTKRGVASSKVGLKPAACP